MATTDVLWLDAMRRHNAAYQQFLRAERMQPSDVAHHLFLRDSRAGQEVVKTYDALRMATRADISEIPVQARAVLLESSRMSGASGVRDGFTSIPPGYENAKTSVSPTAKTSWNPEWDNAKTSIPPNAKTSFNPEWENAKTSWNPEWDNAKTSFNPEWENAKTSISPNAKTSFNPEWENAITRNPRGVGYGGRLSEDDIISGFTGENPYARYVVKPEFNAALEYGSEFKLPPLARVSRGIMPVLAEGLHYLGGIAGPAMMLHQVKQEGDERNRQADEHYRRTHPTGPVRTGPPEPTYLSEGKPQPRQADGYWIDPTAVERQRAMRRYTQSTRNN